MVTTRTEPQADDRVKMLDRRPLGAEPSGAVGDVYNPSTGRVHGHRSRSARRTRSIGPCERPPRRCRPGPRRRSVERARVMFRFRERLAAHAEELAGLVTREHGKTLAEARARSSAASRWSSSPAAFPA